MDYDTGLDTGKIIVIIVLAIGIIGIIFVSYYIVTSSYEAPFKTVCENNPVERTKQPCTTISDCVSKCASRLLQESRIKSP